MKKDLGEGCEKMGGNWYPELNRCKLEKPPVRIELWQRPKERGPIDATFELKGGSIKGRILNPTHVLYDKNYIEIMKGKLTEELGPLEKEYFKVIKSRW